MLDVGGRPTRRFCAQLARFALDERESADLALLGGDSEEGKVSTLAGSTLLAAIVSSLQLVVLRSWANEMQFALDERESAQLALLGGDSEEGKVRGCGWAGWLDGREEGWPVGK